MKIFRLFWISLLPLLLFAGCTSEKVEETITYYETKEDAITAFFVDTGYSQDNIIAIETHNDMDVIVFVERGIGFAVVDHTAEGYRTYWDGRLRDFDTESKGIDGIESFIEVQSADEKQFTAFIGKVFDQDIKKVEIFYTDQGISDYILLKEKQEFWYYFYEGDPSMIEVLYLK